ncbi:MAG: asparaginase domain-containing protein [Phycisphaerales bacterium]
MRYVTLITTGGTIEKTFDEATGQLINRTGAGPGGSVVRRMLRRLRLEDTTVRVIELMSKDSLHMTDDDRERIVEAVRVAGGSAAHPTETTGVVILHGTDTLEKTGERLCAACVGPHALRVPVVLTGAMRPFEMTRSDALQNLTESIFAAGVLPPGVYAAAHGRVLKFPGVKKDRERGTFVGPVA